jgi:hypothetical protein
MIIVKSTTDKPIFTTSTVNNDVHKATPSAPGRVAPQAESLAALDTFERASTTAASTTVFMSKTANAVPGYPAGSVTSHSSRAQGAFFYKMEAPATRGARGMEGVGVLPEVVFDPNRNHVEGLPPAIQAALPAAASSNVEYYGSVYRAGAAQPGATLSALTHFRTGPLDRPSVYMGGRSSPEDVEVDTGLSTDRVYDAQGNATFTTASDMTGGPGSAVFAVGGDAPNRTLYNVAEPNKPLAKGDAAVLSYLGAKKMVPNFGFRPFWRVADNNKPEGQRNTWANPDKKQANQYLYPGQSFSLSVTATGRNPATLTTTIAARGADGKPLQPGQGGSYSFQARGFDSDSMTAFKRINSIDLFHVVGGKRVGTEAKAADENGPARAGVPATRITTTTAATNAQWSSTSILGANGARTPLFNDKDPPALVRGSEWASDVDAYLRIFGAKLTQVTDKDGNKTRVETINITPANQPAPKK